LYSELTGMVKMLIYTTIVVESFTTFVF